MDISMLANSSSLGLSDSLYAAANADLDTIRARIDHVHTADVADSLYAAANVDLDAIRAKIDHVHTADVADSLYAAANVDLDAIRAKIDHVHTADVADSLYAAANADLDTIRARIDHVHIASVTDSLYKTALDSFSDVVGINGLANMDQFLYRNALDSFTRIADIYESSAFDVLDQLEEKNLLRSISKLQNFSLPLYQNVNEVDEISDFGVIELDEFIEKEISTNHDYKKLSGAAKEVIHYFFYIIIPLIVTSYIALYVAKNFNNNEALKNLLSEMNSIKEVLKLTKNPPNNLSKEYLKNYRIVKTDNLDLKTAPNMESNVLLVLLLGTKLTIIDSTDRSWLHVAVESGDEVIDGWVLRRYTAYFK